MGRCSTFEDSWSLRLLRSTGCSSDHGRNSTNKSTWIPGWFPALPNDERPPRDPPVTKCEDVIGWFWHSVLAKHHRKGVWIAPPVIGFKKVNFLFPDRHQLVAHGVQVNPRTKAEWHWKHHFVRCPQNYSWIFRCAARWSCYVASVWLHALRYPNGRSVVCVSWGVSVCASTCILCTGIWGRWLTVLPDHIKRCPISTGLPTVSQPLLDFSLLLITRLFRSVSHLYHVVFRN